MKDRLSLFIMIAIPHIFNLMKQEAVPAHAPAVTV